MPLKIVRNDITKMETEAIVNTANQYAVVGTGCDRAVYQAAGYEELLKYRQANIGEVPEGEAFLTPGFGLKAKYIIHAVSPLFSDGTRKEEQKLRSCYRRSLEIAKEHHIQSLSFPLISTGGYGFPKEEGMRIAVDEINMFLLQYPMLVYLVVFDEQSTSLGSRLFSDLEEYIDNNYVEKRSAGEYRIGNQVDRVLPKDFKEESSRSRKRIFDEFSTARQYEEPVVEKKSFCSARAETIDLCDEEMLFAQEHEDKLQERLRHVEDTFSEYLLYLIRERHMENADVWKRAIVDKKVFSKIKNNPEYHPQKLTALCLCVGAQLNLDETRDLLARAGYALSPCDKTDIIFSYFIENEIYDMIELDIQLEAFGLPCIIN